MKLRRVMPLIKFLFERPNAKPCTGDEQRVFDSRLAQKLALLNSLCLNQVLIMYFKWGT